MGEPQACAHAEVYWYPATNEQGWKCTCGHKPGDPPGYDPVRDKAQIEDKAMGCLLEMQAQGWLCEIGSDQGDDMVRYAMDRCVATSCYDQHTVLVGLLEYRARGHAAYWKGVGEGVLSGNDPRARCQGGNLATCSSVKGGDPVHTCSKEGCACTAQRGLFA